MAKDKPAAVDDVSEATEKEKIFLALKKERAAHAATRAELTAAADKLKQIESLGANPNAEAIAAHVDAMVKAGIAKHAAQSTQKIATLETELSEARGKLTQRTISDAVKEAAMAARMRPEAVAHAITLGNLELRLDEHGEPKAKDGGDVATFIESLKASAPFLWAPAKGAGARGSTGDAVPYTGDNPWSPGPSFNLTKQGQLLKTSPALAKTLQQNAAAMSRQ